MDLFFQLVLLNDMMLATRLNEIYFNVMQSNQYPSSSFRTRIASSHQTKTDLSIVDEEISSNIDYRDAWWCNRGLTIR